MIGESVAANDAAVIISFYNAFHAIDKLPKMVGSDFDKQRKVGGCGSDRLNNFFERVFILKGPESRRVRRADVDHQIINYVFQSQRSGGIVARGVFNGVQRCPPRLLLQ